MTKIDKNMNRAWGFTLIELLLYVAISSIMIVVIAGFVITVLQARVKNQTIAEVDGQAIQVIQIVTQTVRNGTGINSPTQAVSSPSLSIATLDSAKNPTVFNLLNGSIQITEGAGAPMSLTADRITASGLNFSNLSRPNTPGIIRIQFTLTHINPGNRNEYDYSKTYYASASIR